MSASLRVMFLVCLLAFPTSALAINPQQNTNDFKPSPHAFDVANILTTRVAPHLKISGGLWFTYRNNALTIETGNSSTKMVKSQLISDFHFALPIANLLSVGLNLPLFLSSSGDAPSANALPGFTQVKGFAMGDIRLSAKVKFWKNKNRGFGLGLAQEFTFPTATGNNFTGDRGVTWRTSLLFDWSRSGLVLAANLSYLMRKNEEVLQPNAEDEIQLGLGAQIPILCDKLDVLVSFNLRTPVEHFLASNKEVGAVLMAGVRYRFWKGLYATLIGGAGMGNMYGIPAGQFSLNIGWEPSPLACDQDGDGVSDSTDGCPTVPGPKSTRGCPDQDGDGIADKDDACPKEKGPLSTKGCPDRDRDGIADKDDRCPDKPGGKVLKGCPDTDGDKIADRDDRCPKKAGPAKFRGCPDTDGDGIADPDDACPNKAGIAKFKGCPDTDGDGIEDRADLCPKVAGIAKFKGCPDTDGDGIEDSQDACPKKKGPTTTKGCPDRDQDGVKDSEDKCPDVWGRPKYKGCPPPTPKRIKITRKNIQILQKVQFKTNSAKIRKVSHSLLNDVVTVMKQNAWIKKIQVEGHTDDVGYEKENMKLSQRRANSVMNYLIKRGIEPSRLVAKGFGETKPLLAKKTRKARAMNRRVEFNILDPK